MSTLSDAAQQILDEKPRFWEHKLFAQVLTDEMNKCADVRQEHCAGTSSGPQEGVTERQFPRWIQARMNEQADSVGKWASTTEFLVQSSFGSSGQGRDEYFMINLAEELASAYCNAIVWSQRFRRVNLPSIYQPVLKEAAAYSDEYIKGIESLPESLLSQVGKFESPNHEGPKVFRLSVDVTPHNREAMQRESDKLIKKLQG